MLARTGGLSSAAPKEVGDEMGDEPQGLAKKFPVLESKAAQAVVAIVVLGLVGIGIWVVAAPKIGPLEGEPNLEVDNWSGAPLELFVSGKRMGKIEPWTVLAIRVRPGRRELKVMRDGQEVDRAEAKIGHGKYDKLVVFNPQGRGTYMESIYGGVGGQMSSVIADKKLLEADVGLTTIEEPSSGTSLPPGYRVVSGGRSNKVGLSRVIRGKASVEEAIAGLVHVPPQALSSFQDATRALEILENAPDSPGLRTALERATKFPGRYADNVRKKAEGLLAKRGFKK